MSSVHILREGVTLCGLGIGDFEDDDTWVPHYDPGHATCGSCRKGEPHPTIAVGPTYVHDDDRGEWVAYVRMSKEWRPRIFGPKHPSHPSIGWRCPGCGKPMAAGAFTTLVPIGPGADDDHRAKARRGGVFNSVAIELDVACALGYDPWAPVRL